MTASMAFVTRAAKAACVIWHSAAKKSLAPTDSHTCVTGSLGVALAKPTLGFVSASGLLPSHCTAVVPPMATLMTDEPRQNCPGVMHAYSPILSPSTRIFDAEFGLAVGLAVGIATGGAVAKAVGRTVELSVGTTAGLAVGLAVGIAVGIPGGLAEKLIFISPAP